MEKDIGKIKKNEQTDIIIRLDEYGGKPGITIREFVTSERYTGFTKSGTRIPADRFLDFRELINSIPLTELTVSEKEEKEKKPAKKEVKEEAEDKKEESSSDDSEEGYI